MKYINRFLTSTLRLASDFYHWFTGAEWKVKLIVILATACFIVAGTAITRHIQDYNAGYDTHWDTAVVTHLEYTPARHVPQVRYNPATETTETYLQYYPPDYDVFLRGDKDTYHIDVSQRTFSSTAVGDTLYVIGRIGGNSGRLCGTRFVHSLEGEELYNEQPVSRLENTPW